MATDRHLTELPLPPDSAVHQALALLKGQRDAARREAAHYREALETISATPDRHVEMSDTLIRLTLVRSLARRALLWEGKERKRSLRDRAAAWWTTRLAMWRAR